MESDNELIPMTKSTLVRTSSGNGSVAIVSSVGGDKFKRQGRKSWSVGNLRSDSQHNIFAQIEWLC
jgi:hypothetical protein